MKIRISEIAADQDAVISEIIKAVGAEFGAVGEGYGPADAEVACMSQHYSDSSRSRYLVAEVDGQIVGGGGIASFQGSHTTCELRKLFLLPGARGLGLGESLTRQCIDYAKSCGYTECYLETLGGMDAAISLYRKLGFDYLDKPIPGSEHGGCEVWMLKKWG